MKLPWEEYITALAELLFVEKRVLAAGYIVEREPDGLLGDSGVSFVENAIVTPSEVVAAQMNEVKTDHRETVAFVEVLSEKEGK